jgi:hypothetical protein
MIPGPVPMTYALEPAIKRRRCSSADGKPEFYQCYLRTNEHARVARLRAHAGFVGILAGFEQAADGRGIAPERCDSPRGSRRYVEVGHGQAVGCFGRLLVRGSLSSRFIDIHV